MMRCLTILALMGVAHLAMAQGAETAKGVEPIAVAQAPVQEQAQVRPQGKAQGSGKARNHAKAPGRHGKKTGHRAKSMPRGDMRRCLDLKTNKEIIRCSERKKK